MLRKQMLNKRGTLEMKPMPPPKTETAKEVIAPENKSADDCFHTQYIFF